MGRVACRFQSVAPQVSSEAPHCMQRVSQCRDKGMAAQGWVKYFTGYSKSRAVIPKLDFLLLVSNFGYNIKQPVLLMCPFTWFYLNKLDLFVKFIL